MTIPETLLTFVGAPAAIYAVIWLVVLGPGQLRTPARYRPGRPWSHAPAWFVPHPDGGGGGHHVPELTAGDGAASSRTEPIGGASGEW